MSPGSTTGPKHYDSSENNSNREVDASEGGLSGGAYAGIAVMRRENDKQEVELDDIPSDLHDSSLLM
jgi:hypothetical protein